MLAAGGGNRSVKTETMLVHMVMCSTGVFPYSLQHLIDVHFRGPISCRLTVESLTTTLDPVIIPKLQWWKWSGTTPHGGAQGHWGWIPKNCLIDGEWAKSFSAKNRTLRILCRDPHNNAKVLGDSTWQFMSFDQDASDFASGEFHIAAHDEPPNHAIWKENEARAMSVGGRLLLAMTWPDDPSINVDWLYNKVYEPARSGGNHEIEWLELWTVDNKNIDQAAVAIQAAKWSDEIGNVRLRGQPIRFSNRIHPEFTENTKTWCFKCEKAIIPMPAQFSVVGAAPREVCPACQSDNITEFNHVQDFDASSLWPTVFLIDPHPRKPHAYLWVQITPSDDWRVVAEGQCEGDCTDVRKDAERIERDMGLVVAQRLIDPNMGLSPAGQKRGVTWQQEFADAGLNCDLADDSAVGRKRINTMLKPDPGTLQPRMIVHRRCRNTVYQICRYSWDNYATKLDKDEKQTPKSKYDDYPTLLKYLANSEPNFRFLKGGAPILQRYAKRR
ncbi:MAG: hypothetical protein U1E51_07680 [Candidatus Binatia bacterium]|nr:hypothetical protein [Candidatus Binatia bacterium]